MVGVPFAYPFLFWQGQKDLVLSLRRKVEEYFDFATRLRYGATPKTRFAHFREPRARGSDNTPCCHSLPLPFKSFRFKSQQNKKGHALEPFSKGQFCKNTVYLERGMPYSCFLVLMRIFGFLLSFHEFHSRLECLLDQQR